MLGKLRKSLDYSLFTGILFTDLSKAFDCLYLMVAKLHAYGFSEIALKLLWEENKEPK